MLTPLRDYRSPRDWKRPWLDPPGFFPGSGCFCCSSSSSYLYTYFGVDAGSVDRNTYSYAPAGDTWGTTTAGPTPKRTLGGGSLISTKHYAACGTGQPGGTILKDVDEWDPNSSGWTSKTDKSAGRNFHCQATCGSAAYVSYGGTAPATYTKEHAEYTPASDSWTTKTNGPSPDRFETTSAGASSAVFVVTGNNPAAAGMRDTDKWDQAGDSWTSKTDSPTPARRDAAVCAFGSYVYVTGGYDDALSILADHDQYDYGGDSWASQTNCTYSAYNARSTSTASAMYYGGGVLNFFGSYSANLREYVVDSWSSKSSRSTTYNYYGFS